MRARTQDDVMAGVVGLIAVAALLAIACLIAWMVAYAVASSRIHSRTMCNIESIRSMRTGGSRLQCPQRNAFDEYMVRNSCWWNNVPMDECPFQPERAARERAWRGAP